jgi:phosphoribosylanthranilate isomerase
MTGRTRIKICGIRDEEIALTAVECGTDALGFVFYDGSPRFVEPERAYEIACFLPPFVTKVALVVNPEPEALAELGRVFPFDVVQLHGTETVERVRACRETTGAPLMKAIRFDAATTREDLERWGAVDEIDALLVDGSSGGRGTAFDWEALAAVQEACPHPIVLAGGLTPETVGEAIRAVGPYAVDVSSGVERARGVKDAGLIAAFCEAVRAGDAGD